MSEILPYKISVPDSQLNDLKQRLSLARFPDELDEAEWDLGAPLADVKRLTEYWRDKYDWRAAEQKLNEHHQFTANITVDGFAPLKIHFLHQPSSLPNAIPLLFIHGWPGSFIEVTKVINALSSNSTTHLPQGSPSFHVVAISLPNFGFSEGVKKRGFALEHYAECCNKLMLALGYNEYVTQGGDWGTYISRAISLRYPEHCKATHLNMDFGEAPSLTTSPLLALQHAIQPYTEKEKKGLERTKWFLDEGSSYRAQQSQKPQTLGYALADSPVALLAWIYEKLHDWTDSYNWSDGEICTWVSIYWFSTAGPAANVRIYYEVTHYLDTPGKITRTRVQEYIPHVKIGYSHSPKELRVLPNTWTSQLGNIVFERYHESGGHFFAYERPDHLIQDVREMFSRGGGAYNCVKGNSGYAE